jgi:hypothetical protein
MHGFFSEYRGRSVGRLMGVLEVYCGGVSVVEELTFGTNTIFYRGDVFATYTWEGDTDVPVFTFVLKDEWRRAMYEQNQEIFKPLLDEEKYNVTFVMQEISRLYIGPSVSDDEILDFMASNLCCFRGWTMEKCQKYLEHFKYCAKKYWKYQ